MTDEDRLTQLPPIYESSLLLRLAVAFLAGVVVFMAFVILGLVVCQAYEGKYSQKYLDSVFHIFLLIGVIFLFITIGFLLIYWEAKKQRRQGRAGMKAGGRGVMSGRYAGRFGAPLSEFPPPAGLPPRQNTPPAGEEGEKRCPYCGVPNEGGARYCRSCRARLPLP